MVASLNRLNGLEIQRVFISRDKCKIVFITNSRAI